MSRKTNRPSRNILRRAYFLSISLMLILLSLAFILLTLLVPEMLHRITLIYLSFGGLLLGLILVNQWLTHRYRLLHQQSEERYRSAVEASLDAFFLLKSVRDEHGEIIDFEIAEINENAIKQMSMTRTELLGTLICQAFPINRTNGYFEHYKRVVLTGIPFTQEYEIPQDHPASGWYQHQVVKVGDGVAIINRDISEQKRLQASEHEQHAQLERFFNTSLDLLCIADIQGHFLKVNPQWESVLGYTVEELEGHKFFDFIHLDDLEATYQATANLVSNHPVLNFTNRYRAKDGTYRFIEWRSLPSGGQIFAAARDITERIRVENDLRRYKNIFSSASTTAEGIALVNREYRYEIVNHAYVKRMNKPREAIEGRSIADMLGQNAFEQIIKPYFDRSLAGEIIIYEDWFEYAAVGLRCMQVTYFPYYESESFINGVVVMTHDVTQRREIEEALRERERALEQAQSLAHLGNWEVNLKTGENKWSDEFFRICGIEPNSLPASTELGFSLIHPDDRAKAAEAFERSQQTGESYNIEKRIVRPTGEIRSILSQGQILKDERTGEDKLVGTFLDITERKQAQQKAFELALEKERLQVLSNFIQYATHEFRTPLSVISSSTHLIARSEDANYRQQKAEVINAQVQRITKLVDNTLFISKLEGHSLLRQQRLDLNELLQIAFNEIHKKYASSHAVSYTPYSTPLPILGEADYLIEAFKELLDNACRFTPKGGTIQVSIQTQAEQAYITIKDTGVGMTSEELSHIFETFWRKDKEHSQSGLGLGLTIAQRVIHLHEGKLTVESQPEQGTRITVSLPTQSLATQTTHMGIDTVS